MAHKYNMTFDKKYSVYDCEYILQADNSCQARDQVQPALQEVKKSTAVMSAVASRNVDKNCLMKSST